MWAALRSDEGRHDDLYRHTQRAALSSGSLLSVQYGGKKSHFK